MYHVIWYEGWDENTHSFDTLEEASMFIDNTGADPDEFDILECPNDDF